MTMKSWLASLAAAGLALAVPAAASASAHLPHQGGEKQVTSGSRAGYVALAGKGTKFRYVAADFTLGWPGCNLLGPDESELFSQWAGLGGYNHGTAWQIGMTEWCVGGDGDGETSFYAWYRNASGQETDFYSCVLPDGYCPRGPIPGDRIQLSVYYNGKSYRLLFDDVTRRVHRGFYLRCRACRSNSAEVISQGSYNASGSPAPALTVDFFGIRVTSAGGKHGTIAAQPRYWTSTKIIMVDSAGHDLAVPSALLRHGRAFHVDVSAPVGCTC